MRDFTWNERTFARKIVHSFRSIQDTCLQYVRAVGNCAIRARQVLLSKLQKCNNDDNIERANRAKRNPICSQAIDAGTDGDAYCA